MSSYESSSSGIETLRSGSPAYHHRFGGQGLGFGDCGTGSPDVLIDSCISQLQAQGPSRTCNESREEKKSTCAAPPAPLGWSPSRPSIMLLSRSGAIALTSAPPMSVDTCSSVWGLSSNPPDVRKLPSPDEGLGFGVWCWVLGVGCWVFGVWCLVFG